MVRQEQGVLAPDEVKAMVAACFREMLVDAVNFMAPGVAKGSVVANRPASPQLQHHGPTLDEAIDVYLEAKRRTWTDKTYESRRRRLDYLRQQIGGGTALRAITTDDVRSLRDAICRLRRQQGRPGLEMFAAKQTENVAHRIDAKTAILIFEPVKAFFRWSKSEQGYIATNPADDIRISAPKRIKGSKTRRPFTAAELTQLFSAPLFTGCLSRSRRFDPGNLMIRDAKFWIPILGFYTGARLGELVQLHLNDVGLEDDIGFLRITEEVAGYHSPGEEKHVKSHAGVRRIPLHADLIALGFLDFVESRRRHQTRRSKRLFPEIKFGADRQASTVFSKWFGRLMSKVGLNDPALVFHSFRHNAEDAFRDALRPQYVIDKIIGHSDGATSAGYGEGASLSTLKEAVDAMRLKVHLPIGCSVSLVGGGE